MSFYRVTYQSMTAFYGPSFVEAQDASEAKRKFAKGAFTQGEMALIRAVEVSGNDIRKALEDQ